MKRSLLFRTMSRILPGVLTALVLFFVGVPEALAHAALVRSSPADNAILVDPPGEVRLWFNETISAEFSSVQVFDLHGQQITLTGWHRDAADPMLMVLTLPSLGAGVYSVHWRVLSEADGHFTQGLMVFGVGEGAEVGAVAATGPESSLPPAEVLLRWLNFGLLAALIGGLAARYLVLAAVRVLPESEPALARAQSRALAWTWVSGAAALMVGLALLVYQAFALRQSLPEGMPFLEVTSQLLGRSRWGTLWALRQAILLIFVSLTFLLYRHRRVSKPVLPEKPVVILAVVLALSLTVVQALNGHAAALADSTLLAVSVDALHLLAVSLWLGTLLALAAGLLPMLRRAPGDFGAVFRAGLRPFGRLATPSIGVIAATGLYSMGRQVTSADALVLTFYGRMLAGKVGLMLAAGALGLLNSVLLHPQLAAPLARLLRRPAGWTPLSLRRLPILVAGEASLGLLLFLAAGLLTSSPPARGPEFSVVTDGLRESVAQTADDLMITFSAKPNKPGQNVMTIRAISSRRPEPAEVMRVILRFTYLGQEMGTLTADADKVEPALYRLGGSYFSLPGPWQVEVAVRRKGMEDSVARFDWTVAPAGMAGREIISQRAWRTPLTIVSMSLLGLVLVGTTLVFTSARRHRADRRVRSHRISQADLRP